MKNKNPHLLPEWAIRLPDSAWPIPLDKIRRLQQGYDPADETVELDRHETLGDIQDAVRDRSRPVGQGR